MFHLVYVSNAIRPLKSAELEDILRVSREGNAQIEVTGLLLYKDGHFMQLLEGAEETVRALLEKITRDPRHYNVLTLLEGATERRHFPDWSMGFRALDEEARGVPGYREFERLPLTEEAFSDDPAGCLRLLRLFRAHV